MQARQPITVGLFFQRAILVCYLLYAFSPVSLAPSINSRIFDKQTCQATSKVSIYVLSALYLKLHRLIIIENFDHGDDLSPIIVTKKNATLRNRHNITSAASTLSEKILPSTFSLNELSRHVADFSGPSVVHFLRGYALVSSGLSPPLPA